MNRLFAIVFTLVATSVSALADQAVPEPATSDRSKQAILQDLAKRLAETGGRSILMSEADRRVALANTHLIAPVRTLAPSPNAYALTQDLRPEISDIEFDFEAETFSVGSVLKRHVLMWFLIFEGDTIHL